MMDHIELDDVTKTYGPATSLAECSLTFEPGGVHALVGPNGAGKTTLFRVLLGLTRPDSGTVSVPDVTTGCVFQTPQVYEGLTVRENLDLLADLTDASPAWVETLIDRCGLGRVLHRSAGALSAGFGKRLDIALSFIDEPDLVLLDEPLADVGDEYRSRLIDFLQDYAAGDRLLVVATHQFAWFEDVLDTVTVLVDGRVRVTESMTTLDAEYGGDLSAFYSETLGTAAGIPESN